MFSFFEKYHFSTERCGLHQVLPPSSLSPRIPLPLRPPPPRCTSTSSPSRSTTQGESVCRKGYAPRCLECACVVCVFVCVCVCVCVNERRIKRERARMRVHVCVCVCVCATSAMRKDDWFVCVCCGRARAHARLSQACGSACALCAKMSDVCVCVCVLCGWVGWWARVYMCVCA